MNKYAIYLPKNIVNLYMYQNDLLVAMCTYYQYCYDIRIFMVYVLYTLVLNNTIYRKIYNIIRMKIDLTLK